MELVGRHGAPHTDIPPLYFVKNGEVIGRVDPGRGKNIKINPDWRVGSFWYKEGVGYCVFLGKKTALIRKRKVIAVGWDGEKDSPLSTEVLKPGDMLVFRKTRGTSAPFEYSPIRVDSTPQRK